MTTPEHVRLTEDRNGTRSWHRWGPYVSERQWGTVREDYSTNGDAWAYLSHDDAIRQAYRWGEDGIGSLSDERQYVCLGLALWNGQDPILKERLFGLTNGEGNHGEDVKEIYHYLDATPTHSYLRMLYKYPHQRFPYEKLRQMNRQRGKLDPEYEILDTGIFHDNRYFDINIEYAKADTDDILWQITAYNRGPTADLHILPQVWFRNTWTWTAESTRPSLERESDGALGITHPFLGFYWLYIEGEHEWLFCENETNPQRWGLPTKPGYYKDGIHQAVVHGRRTAVNPARIGTKAAAHTRHRVPAGGSVRVRLRLVTSLRSDNLGKPQLLRAPFHDFADLFTTRKQEADVFYATVHGNVNDPAAQAVQRQAYAGLIWSRQMYRLNQQLWRNGDPGQPPPPGNRTRNAEWEHLSNSDLLTMPDKWEYPYYCVWDTAFQCVALAAVDAHWAKQELLVFLRECYMHPNGQIPAYEWNFSDVNPPVHAWATWRVFQMDQEQRGDAGDLPFLERSFHKLMLNFTWWVNRKDARGLNIFQGGFLGMDNIGVFNRSEPLPPGYILNQADGTSWMAMYSLNLMRMALELALHNPVYQDVAVKFFEHFLAIAAAMTNMANKDIGLWHAQDEFYYDEITLPNGEIEPLRLRSMVGLVPLFAVEVLDPDLLERVPEFTKRMQWVLTHKPELAALVSRWSVPGRNDRRLLSLLRGSRMKALLRRMLDPNEFLSDHGVRTLSRQHLHEPYRFRLGQSVAEVKYVPADSDSYMFGGNSNWRGPVWMPMNYLIIESLLKFQHYYGDDFLVEAPTHSGQARTIADIARDLSRRLTTLFLPDAAGRRALHGNVARWHNDPHFREHLLFYEYFDGDTGRGLGASHQTGWTALVAQLLKLL
jgi:hypothetical protein